jgi:hypothetical protein
MIRNIIIASLLIICFLTSCRKEIVIDSVEKRLFLQESSVGCYKSARDYLIYNPSIHQISVNAKRNTVRLQTDDQKVFFNIQLENFPKSIGVNIPAKVYQGVDGVISEYTYLFECSKIEHGQIWLWNKEGKIGVIVPMYR